MRAVNDARDIRTIGLVVHPKRQIDGALATVHEWAERNGASVGQVEVNGQHRTVADPVAADAVDVILAVGGDGTALAALHAGARASRPVLGVACGSIGALTSVHADRVEWALGEVAAGRFDLRRLPALAMGGDRFAINDAAIVRNGGGQVAAAVSVDGELYARVAGDGVVVSTARGSSAYTLAAGGPLLASGCDSFVITPLAPHGGSIPPLVVGGDSSIELDLDPGHGGMRLEIDGQASESSEARIEISQRSDYARLVTLGDDESLLTGLRRRGLVLDSPRATMREKRGTTS